MKQLLSSLKRRNIEAFYCPTAKEAVEKVSSLINDGDTVTWGGSATIRDIGLPDFLKSRGTLNILDRDSVPTPEEKQQIYLQAFSADVYLTSANAISEDGVIINIDGNGNRVAAITWGPKKVIFIIGINKIAPTIESALERARNIAAPVNAKRFDIKLPRKHLQLYPLPQKLPQQRPPRRHPRRRRVGILKNKLPPCHRCHLSSFGRISLKPHGLRDIFVSYDTSVYIHPKL